MLALAALGACSSTPPPSTGGTGNLVALGDSFTANSYHTPTTTTNGCTQSLGNQPNTVAARIGAASVVDASCDGATTADILAPGTGSASQISFVTSSTTVVTLSIGGNDIGFSDIVKNCTVAYLTFGGCKADYVNASGDAISDRITATQAKVVQVLAAIHSKAPSAKVFVYGYPTLVPMTGSSGCVGLTLASGDISYLRDKQGQLNSMLSATASSNGATYIDVYGPSAGHDPCASNNWVARVIDLPPVHPTKAGMTAIADIVATQVAAGI